MNKIIAMAGFLLTHKAYFCTDSIDLMFHIFSKKRFLVDSLAGFVDIHNHILPGIDDGAKTVEESIAMIKEFESFGVKRFIATPHIMSDYYPNTPETIQNALSFLKTKLLTKDMGHIALEAAAEHMIDEYFDSRFDARKIMPIRGRFLLIEMSYLQASFNFDEAVEKITSSGCFPILAHPERYDYLRGKKNTLEGYKKKNVLLQMNMLSLSEYYGKDVQRTAVKMLNNGLIDFLGSDVHSMRQLNALRETSISNATFEQMNPIIQNTIRNFL